MAVSSLVIIWFAHNGRFVAQVLVLFVLIVLVIIVVRISRRWRYRVADNRGGAPLDQTGGSGRMVSAIARTKATAQGMHAGRPNMRR
ncbi:MAG: hypothetical protein WAN94_00515 [Pseudolabrys sp.]